MNSVEPIRDQKKIADMKTYLKGQSIRNYALFTVGVNLALRVSDLAILKWKDVLQENLIDFKDVMYIREKKTEKERVIAINDSMKKALRELLNTLDGMKVDDYIFPSKKGQNKPLTRQMIAVIITEAGNAVGLERIGTHSMRKTWGYWAWKNNVHLALIQECLGHSSIAVTKRYLGITQDETNSVYKNLNL